MISPKEIDLGKSYRRVGERCKQISDKGYIIPFKKTIHSLYQMPEFQHCLEHSHASTDKFMRDLCDGDYIRNHLLFKRNPWHCRLS